jgi:hypothetical protein
MNWRIAFFLILGASVRMAEAQAAPSDSIEFMLRHEIPATRMLGIPPMTRQTGDGAPAREVRLYVGMSFKSPDLILRLVDSGGQARADRAIWWRKEDAWAPAGAGVETLAVKRADSRRDSATRKTVLSRFKCDSLRMTPHIDACLLRDDRRMDARAMFAEFDSLGVFRLPSNADLGLDGGMIIVETWNGLRYRFYYYWEPSARSKSAAIRAAAEIMRRVQAIVR